MTPSFDPFMPNPITRTPDTLRQLLDGMTYEPGDNDPQRKQRKEGYAHADAWQLVEKKLKVAKEMLIGSGWNSELIDIRLERFSKEEE